MWPHFISLLESVYSHRLLSLFCWQSAQSQNSSSLEIAFRNSTFIVIAPPCILCMHILGSDRSVGSLRPNVGGLHACIHTSSKFHSSTRAAAWSPFVTGFADMVSDISAHCLRQLDLLGPAQVLPSFVVDCGQTPVTYGHFLSLLTSDSRLLTLRSR